MNITLNDIQIIKVVIELVSIFTIEEEQELVVNIARQRVHGRRRSSSGVSRSPSPPAQVAQPEITANIFAAATPYPSSQYPNNNTPPYYPPPPAEMLVPLPAAANPNWVNARHPLGSQCKLPSPTKNHRRQ
ncbi:Hypothetical predicted protein [Olea europaea subsp. europaea]|uniref:Uncharacterized protein n=1 Tax=Olea europaea subsp. europaea TaxID=158383 RepID=A0A8S0RJJ9_OLEEU|nr:Hypothetical predicted protein [Olea europaea subsp. europaea]